MGKLKATKPQCQATIPGGAYRGLVCSRELEHDGQHDTGTVIDPNQYAERRTDLGNGFFGWREVLVRVRWRS